MRKLMSLALAASVALSLSACRTANVGIEDRNNGVTDGSTNQGRTAGLNNNTNVNANYKDGIYTGFGDAHNNGNERAIVTIRNGRISNVDLDRTNQQGGTNTGNAAGNGTNNQDGTVGNAVGNVTGAASDAFNTVKTNLITAIIQNQRHDVDIQNNDANTRGTVDNWKLAVQRALDQARK